MKTYPEVFGRAKNLLSVQYRSQILRDNNLLPNQLLLSSEIAPFEGGLTQKGVKPSKYIETLSVELLVKSPPLVAEIRKRRGGAFY